MALEDVLPGFFWGNDPNVNQQLRQRIALQMMAGSGKKGFPKNLGEGLSAIGDSIGELGMARRLEQADLAQQKAAAAGLGPPAAPAAAAPVGARTAYAPPGDTMSDAPEPGSGPIATAAPEGGFNSIDAQAPETDTQGVSGGGYNLLDAQAGMKRSGQGRVQDAVTAAYPDNPDMQAYASQLAAGEQQVPGDTSKTGARGPWQFVPGTAKQYGLTNPDDPMASAQALKSFTANNAAIFQRINGRPPTMAELALMHQQGGQTGASMIAGTGNASSRNLALNKVPAGAGPAQAVGAIKNYYGMPDRPVNARDAVAQAMMMRPTAQAVPQPNPTSTGGPTTPPTSPTGQTPTPSIPALASGAGDQRLAFNGLPPEIDQGISAAPPAPSALRQVPQQVAQATSQQMYPAGYVPPPAADPTMPPQVKMDPRELELRTKIANNPGNPYYATQAAPELQALTQDREARQAYANKMFEAKLTQQTEATKLRTQAQIDQAKRQADVAYTQTQTRKEGLIKEPEEQYTLGPDGVARPVQIEGQDPNAPPSGKLSETEQKTLIYRNWAQQGNQAITGNDKLLANGLQQELLGKVPFVGNKEQNDAYRRAKNGADNFILAFMRSTSGAAYGAQERLDHAHAMLPRYGDDAKTLADKAAQRQGFIDTEYAGLGRQGKRAADYVSKSYDPVSAENRQRLVDIEMQGVKGTIPGEVKTNHNRNSPNFGQQRMWNGTRWVETQ